jgi:VWFA-related protein
LRAFAPNNVEEQFMMPSLQYLNAALLLATFVPAFAQLPATDATSGSIRTFGSRVDLVLVPVIASDAKGHHVSGLKIGAFHLNENGKPQVVSIFEEITARRMEQNAAQSALAQGFSNIAVKDTQAQRVTILVLDLLNTPFIYQRDARKELVKYLSKSLDSNEPITLLGIDGRGLRQVHSFTTDTRVLVEALNRMRGRYSATEMNDADSNASNDSVSTASLFDPAISGTVDRFEEFFSNTMAGMAAMDQRNAVRRTLVGLNQIAQAFSGIPGRKTLIWATAGFPFMIDDPSSIGYMGLDMVGLYEQTWRALMSANVAVYPVDLQGVLPKYQNPSLAAQNNGATNRKGPRSASDVNQRPLQPWTRAMPYDRLLEQQKTMRAFAAATGGIVCLNFNDLAKCFEQATSDSSSYYLLGFYLSPDDRKPGWRRLKVEVTEKGTRVRAREGFYVGGQPEENGETRKAAIDAALTSPVEFTGVPMNVRWTERTVNDKEGKISAKFSMTIPAPLFTLEDTGIGVVNLQFSAAAFDGNGKAVAEISKAFMEKLSPESIAQIRRAGFRYQGVIDYPARTKQVRFAVRNNATGDIGSIIAPVEAP